MTDSIINVGVIGAGSFARTHFESLSRIPNAKISAVADLDEAKLAKAAADFDIPANYADYRKILADPAIDAVYVLVRPQVMFPIVMDVLQARKHVFTEKPFGANFDQSRAMAETALRFGVKSAVGCNRRYCAVLRRAKEIVEEQGPISGVLGEFHKDCGESIFYDTCILRCDGVHALDALRYLGGDVSSVYAHADRWYRTKGWEGYNNVFHALIRFENGATGVFLANRQNGARREYFEVHGRDISAYIYTPDHAEIFRSKQRAPEVILGKDLVGSDEMIMTYGYYHESVDFLDAIRFDRTPQTNFSDNLKTMVLCDQVSAGDHIDRT